MPSIEKFDRLAGYAFENALRYHYDSISLYNIQAYASAYQLSILASEELGKAIMLNEFVWQYFANDWNFSDPHVTKWLKSIFTTHVVKQGWFARFANDFLSKNPHLKKASPLIDSLFNGITEEDKQRSTYVGLSKRSKKVNLDGRISVPLVFAKPEKSEKQITLNNDFLIVYISGFLRGVYGIDSYNIALQMSADTLESLKTTWTTVGSRASQLLSEHDAIPVVDNPLDDWED